MSQTPREEFSAISEKVVAEVKPIVESVLGQHNYEPQEVPTWVDAITGKSLEKLQDMSYCFKYIVSVVVLQKSNTGFHLFSTCYWDQAVDGTVTVRWENKTMHC
eukprot:Trichotokara_eunicae@DN5907_c0_g1_i4.p1